MDCGSLTLAANFFLISSTESTTLSKLILGKRPKLWIYSYTLVIHINLNKNYTPQKKLVAFPSCNKWSNTTVRNCFELAFCSFTLSWSQSCGRPGGQPCGQSCILSWFWSCVGCLIVLVTVLFLGSVMVTVITLIKCLEGPRPPGALFFSSCQFRVWTVIEKPKRSSEGNRTPRVGTHRFAGFGASKVRDFED